MVQDALLHLLVRFQVLAAHQRDERGQTLAEYGLVLSVVAVGAIVTSVVAFRDVFIGAFDTATSCLGGTC